MADSEKVLLFRAPIQKGVRHQLCKHGTLGERMLGKLSPASECSGPEEQHSPGALTRIRSKICKGIERVGCLPHTPILCYKAVDFHSEPAREEGLSSEQFCRPGGLGPGSQNLKSGTTLCSSVIGEVGHGRPPMKFDGRMWAAWLLSWPARVQEARLFLCFSATHSFCHALGL